MRTPYDDAVTGDGDARALRASDRAEKRERLGTRGSRILPHAGPVHREQDPTAGKSGALRAAIFGMNDGLVSNLSLIFGVAGSGVDHNVVVIAGIAGLLAGAFSMAAGEYVSMKVQREVFEQLIHTEAHELATQPDEERQELAEIYESRGIRPEVAARLTEELMRDPELALETHAREELGIDVEEGLGSPWAAAGSSFATFAVGAFVPLLPFLAASGRAAEALSGGLSAATLFGVGGAVTILTGRGFVRSGARMLAIGAAAAMITYVVGSVLNVTVM
jgi:vacuolar iron transporter family protein